MGEGHLDRTKSLVDYYLSQESPLVDTDPYFIIKLAYLADWKSAVNYGDQITELIWELNEDHEFPVPTEEFRPLVQWEITSAEHQREHLKQSESGQSLIIAAITALLRLIDRRSTTRLTSQLNELQHYIAESVIRAASSPGMIDRMIEATYPVATQLLSESAQSLKDLADDYNREYEVLERNLNESELAQREVASV